ncbi:unnamed protein product [Paramecium pentaurelia]|uniref:Uncharacterized protein n=1 Tax=Paramecium pentaurelia TaxID=43138 RepID=A0A8S1WFP1_9CILI|nr:unnamed protein product [Paramecium pentaurelia]
MDTSNIPAAGSRPTKQTFDQAPLIRQVIQNKSDIFGLNSPAPVQQPSRQSARPKTDIFSTETQTMKQQEVRQNKTFQSQIFSSEPIQDVPPPARNNQTFETSKQDVKRFQKKNNDNRQIDHGKEFLFGKSDFDEYKSLKRAVTLNEFKPKLNYDPNNRRNKELYGNEIAREHLPTKEVNLEVSSPQKPKKSQQQQQQDQNPSNRKLMENQSNVFGDSPSKPIQGQKVEKLTASTQKWSTVGGQSNNQVKEFDPETYAKNKKEAELQSSVFGDQSVKVQPVSISESKEESETQQSQSQQEQSQKQQKTKERLIPNNQTWQQTDSVKNMRDFDPTQSQVKDEIDPSQKKMNILKSSMDTHQFEPQQIPVNQKISNKSLKQKKDIIQREEKINKEKSTKTQKK